MSDQGRGWLLALGLAGWVGLKVAALAWYAGGGGAGMAAGPVPIVVERRAAR